MSEWTVGIDEEAPSKGRWNKRRTRQACAEELLGLNGVIRYDVASGWTATCANRSGTRRGMGPSRCERRTFISSPADAGNYATQSERGSGRRG
jgi:hypothetical protein